MFSADKAKAALELCFHLILLHKLPTACRSQELGLVPWWAGSRHALKATVASPNGEKPPGGRVTETERRTKGVNPARATFKLILRRALIEKAALAGQHWS